jgi:Rieske Fe-S protein
LKSNQRSRRYFLKTLGAVTGAAFLGLWGIMTGDLQKAKRKKTINIPLNTGKEVLFSDDCIVINGEQPEVFSSSCTHLGCRIRTFEDGKLVCPCHGSVFDLNGNPLKGPAVKPLEKLEFTINKNTNVMTIKV